MPSAALPVMFSVALALPGPTAAPTPGSPLAIAQLHQECVRPALLATPPDMDGGMASYRIEVRGQRFEVMVEERANFALTDRAGNTLAIVKVDRPPALSFAQQAEWRQRWLRDVAERVDAVVEYQVLAGDARLLTINRRKPGGKFLGISLLVDQRRQVLVQWEWPRSGSVANLEQARAVQSSVWNRLIPCMLDAAR
ncbi:MAG TPA: hypothetical protein VFT37_05415 [Telluria sp.]|nr:hypothetical protein [Telluria sp.]